MITVSSGRMEDSIVAQFHVRGTHFHLQSNLNFTVMTFERVMRFSCGSNRRLLFPSLAKNSGSTFWTQLSLQLHEYVWSTSSLERELHIAASGSWAPIKQVHGCSSSK